jgi:hypothetical protein
MKGYLPSALLVTPRNEHSSRSIGNFKSQVEAKRRGVFVLRPVK